MAFGFGRHFCVGAHLARLEARTAVRRARASACPSSASRPTPRTASSAWPSARRRRCRSVFSRNAPLSSVHAPFDSVGAMTQPLEPAGRVPSASARPRSAATRRWWCRACAPPRRATSTPPSPSASSCARAGAGVVRIAVDNEKEVAALKEIRRQTDGDALGRPAGELPPGGERRPVRRQDPLQPRPPAPRRARQVDRRQGRAGWSASPRDTRLRDPHRRQLRLGRAGVPRALSGRSARGDRAVGALPLRPHGRARLRPLRRVAQGLRSRQGGRRQPTLRRGAPGRAAAPRRHRGRAAARGHHQDAPRLREAARRAASATPSASR